LDLIVPGEGYSSNVPGEGYSSNVSGEGYSSNVPGEGYSSNVPGECYSRNASCTLNLISTFSFKPPEFKDMTRHRKLKKCLIILLILILIIICVVAFNWIKFSIFLSSSDGPYNIVYSQTQVRTYFKIPLIVHQMWKNNNIPKHWKKPQQSWIHEISAVNKSREAVYMFWNNRKLHTFINESFPWFYETFRSYRYNIQRADAAHIQKLMILSS